MTAVYGNESNIDSWMELVRKVRWNFPGLETEEAIEDYKQTALRFMGKQQALCCLEDDKVIGVLLFSRNKNMICCMAVDPDHRKQGIASSLLGTALGELDRTRDITVSTFREDDEKGIAPRALYKKFGFQEGDLTVEFDYPNQVFVLKPEEKEVLPDELQAKLTKLKDYIRDLGSLAVGFSGGVDSSFLLVVAHEVLGDKAIAVTGVDASVPERELAEAKAFCEERGIRQVLRTWNPMQEEGYRNNSPDRCYFCKKGIFTEIRKAAEEYGIEYLAEGSNMDDLGDYRPGLRAVEELSVKSPLREAGLYKADIRNISKAMGLPTWSKPAYACLASRFVYGEEITEKKLHMIDLAEQFLIENGFYEERVRMHGNLARIEVPAKDIERLAEPKMREAVYKKFKEIGFLFVTLDMHGYKVGSMNATINTVGDI